MPLSSSGIIKFSDIGIEFGDTNPIKLSDYFKDFSAIYTRHIDIFPSHPVILAHNFPQYHSPFPPSESGPIKLSIFRNVSVGVGGGSWKDGDPSTLTTAPTAVSSSLSTNTIGNVDTGFIGTDSTYEIITGLKAFNLDRTDGTTIDNRGAAALGSSLNEIYPNEIIQAKRGDRIRMTGNVKTRWVASSHPLFAASSGSTVNCEFWIIYKPHNDYIESSGWKNKNIQTEYRVTTSGRDVEYDLYLRHDIEPGNYAIAVVCNRTSGTKYRSWKSYSLHVWG